MTDPLEDRLRDFAADVPALHPSSPAVVRRRGDRLRRRRTALATAGAALAVAVVVAPVLALASDDRALEQPALVPTTSATPTPTPTPSATATPRVRPSSPPPTPTTTAPDDPETTTTAPPEPPPLTEARLPSPGDLPAAEGTLGWQEVAPTDDWLVACQPDAGTDGGLDAVDRVTRSYAATADVPRGTFSYPSARARVTVLDMGSVAAAEAAEDTVTGWLRDCVDPVEPALALEEAEPADLVATEDGTYVARSYFAGSDVCGDDAEGCASDWFDRMGVLASEERLVVVSFRRVGGYREPPPGLDAAIDDLLRLVAELN